MPGRRNDEPIRLSRPMPRATSVTSAPTSSQTFAISLMNEILVARKAFAASLIISAEATSVRTISPPSGAVDRLDLVGRPLVAGVGADHHPVGVQEVLHRRALLQELRARDVGEVGVVAADRPAGARRDGALHDQRVLAVARELRDHRLDPREVRVARVGRRSVHAAEEQPRGLERLGHLGGEPQALAVALAASSSIPGSWIGTSPPLRASTLAASMSIAITSWPSSAKQLAVTRPTQPTPITPIGRCSLIHAPMIAAARRSRAQPVYLRIDWAIPSIWPGVSTFEQRVVDPVGRPCPSSSRPGAAGRRPRTPGTRCPSIVFVSSGFARIGGSFQSVPETP